MTSFKYTDEYSVDSTVIDEVYYNANANTAVLDVSDYLYEYSNVSEKNIKALVDADSVGAYYNTTFKPVHGPGVLLGFWSKVDYQRVPLVTQPETTKEFSLASVPAPVKVDNSGTTYDVHFTLDGYDKVYKYKGLKVGSVDEAIESLNDYVVRLGAKGKVVKVVVKFD